MDVSRKIISLHFNQDYGCITCATEDGVRIYNVEPLTLSACYKKEQMGSVALAEMLWRTNIIAIVGGGSKPKFADNAVLFYDDLKNKFITEITCKTPVVAVKMHRQRIAIALQKKIHVFSFLNDLHSIFDIETGDNPKGLMEIASLKAVLVYPASTVGSIGIINIGLVNKNSPTVTTRIKAHQEALACLAVNSDGTRVATGSIRGTIIRIWDPAKLEPIAELRRGTTPADLYCMNFRADSKYLCVSSNRGTIHIFAIDDSALNQKLLSGNFLGNFMPSERSFIKFTVSSESPNICAFGKNNSVIVACMDGTFHKYNFSLNGTTECVQYDTFFKTDDDIEEC